MNNINRTNLSNCTLERVPGSNRHRYSNTKKPKLSRSKTSKVDRRPPSCNEQMSEFSTFQWNQSNQQRLYPTMSDSAVCSYPVPVNIPVDPRFHTIYPVYQPYVSVGIGREYLEPNPHSASSRDQFTSLPPINMIDNESEIKRTHSDPGLNNQDDTFESISSESDQESLDTCYANEVAELKKDNQRLANELELVKIELRNIKLDISSTNEKCVCTDPGSITNIIQEIRAAHKLMEQTLESKFNSINANKNVIINDNSQVSLIHERLEKLEKAYDLTNNTKLNKMLDPATRVKNNLKNNNSPKKSSNQPSSVVTAL